MYQPQQQSQQHQFAHRKSHVIAPAVASQNEAQAKQKLAGYVYEYLMHSGAQKTAETFKNEMLNLDTIAVTPTDSPGFLSNWWCVFWDLYSATPERRDKMDPSQEAKAFHEYGFVPGSNFAPGSLMNGIHSTPTFGNGGAPPMGMPPNADGILPYFARSNNQAGGPQANQTSPIGGGPRYGGNHSAGGTTASARSGAPTPSNVMGSNGPPNFAPGTQPLSHMLAAEQMRLVQAQQQQQRLNPNASRMPNFATGMRIRPAGFPSGMPQFMDSSSGTSPFAQNAGIMPNGMCPLMSSPGSQQNGGGVSGSVGPPTSNSDGSHDARFMMMGGGAGMPAQFSINHHDGAGTPNGSSNSAFNGGVAISGTNSVENPVVSSVGQLQNLLNGGSGNVGDSNSSGIEMKQSPINSGTPGGAHLNPGSIQPQQQGGGGPASAHGCHGGPGSVQSQSGGAPGSVVGAAGPNSQQPHQPTTSDSTQNSMDFQASAPTSSQGGDEEQEISKIKASLIEGFGSTGYVS